jgi:hypothetical protein
MLASVPNMEFESETGPNGNPDSDQKQPALASMFASAARRKNPILF